MVGHPGGVAVRLRLLPLLCLAACVDVGQAEVSMVMRVAGTQVSAPVAAANGWSVELTSAQLAFGPLYLCPGFEAGALCDSARAEWVDSAVVDALDPSPRDAGVLTGVSGTVNSWMYDLGITSLLTQQAPTVLPAAEALGGNSVRLTGVARRAGRQLPFEVQLRIQQENELGVSIIRKSKSERFQHELGSDDAALTVRFDASPWMKEVDFDELVEDASCAPQGPATVCAADVQRSCAPDGSVSSQRDCAAEGLRCLRGQGCVDRARFAPGSQGDRAVRNAVVAGVRPSFEWSKAP